MRTAPVMHASPIEPSDLSRTIDELEAQIVALHQPALLGASAAMVAHEFNNLLTPLLVRAQDALDRDDPAAMRKTCEKAIVQAQRAIQLCRHLMGVASANGEHGPRSCRVLDAVNEAVQSLFRPFEKDGITFTAKIDRDIAVTADPVLLHQVLLNLLLNARKAMETTRGFLAVSAARDDGFVVIDVRDSGVGFPDDRMDTLLNPFLRADEREQPRDWLTIGLGLAVCRKIARENGATIEAFPNDGPGCTFRIRWPAANV